MRCLPRFHCTLRSRFVASRSRCCSIAPALCSALAPRRCCSHQTQETSARIAAAAAYSLRRQHLCWPLFCYSLFYNIPLPPAHNTHSGIARRVLSRAARWWIRAFAEDGSSAGGVLAARAVVRLRVSHRQATSWRIKINGAPCAGSHAQQASGRRRGRRALEAMGVVWCADVRDGGGGINEQKACAFRRPVWMTLYSYGGV